MNESVTIHTRSGIMLPGSLIKTGLEFLGIDPASCNCVERAAEMDAWGVAGCRTNIEKIVAWFRDEGVRHGAAGANTPQFRNLVRQGIVLAINRSEQLQAMESGENDDANDSDSGGTDGFEDISNTKSQDDGVGGDE